MPRATSSRRRSAEDRDTTGSLQVSGPGPGGGRSSRSEVVGSPGTEGTSGDGRERAGVDKANHATRPPPRASAEDPEYRTTGPACSYTKPPIPAPRIGPMPNPTIAAMELPVE